MLQIRDFKMTPILNLWWSLPWWAAPVSVNYFIFRCAPIQELDNNGLMLRHLQKPWGATEGFVFSSDFCSLLHFFFKPRQKKSQEFYFFICSLLCFMTWELVKKLKIFLPESFLLFLFLGGFFFFLWKCFFLWKFSQEKYFSCMHPVGEKNVFTQMKFKKFSWFIEFVLT